jgi:hypothetical protein
MRSAANDCAPHPVSRGTVVSVIACGEYGSTRNGAHAELSSVVVGVVERSARGWSFPSVRRSALPQRCTRWVGHWSIGCTTARADSTKERRLPTKAAPAVVVMSPLRV